MLDEAKNINKSLSALGNVISALAEGTVRPTAPPHTPTPHRPPPAPECRRAPAEGVRAVPGQQNDAHPAGLAGGELPHHHVHLLLPLQLQRRRDQIHAYVRAAVRGGHPTAQPHTNGSPSPRLPPTQSPPRVRPGSTRCTAPIATQWHRCTRCNSSAPRNPLPPYSTP